MQSVNVCTKKKLSSTQVKALSKYSGEKEVSKILQSNAHVTISNIEASDAKAEANAAVIFNALVCFSDGTFGNIVSESTHKIHTENSAIKAGQAVSILHNVLEVHAGTKSGSVDFEALVNFDTYNINTAEIKGIAVDEGIYTKESDVEVTAYRGSLTYNNSIKHIESKDANFKDLCFADARVFVKNISVNGSFINVAGGVIISSVYEAEEGTLKSAIKQIDFNSEIEANNIDKDIIVQVQARNSGVKINAEGEKFEFDVPYTLNVDIYQKSVQECIIDAYSISKEVQLTTSSFEQSEFLPTKYAEENLVASFSIEANKPRIEKILTATSGNVVLTNAYAKTNEVICEGISNINITYLSEDEEGNNVLNSVVVDVPYSLNVPCLEATSNDNVEAQVVLGDISIKNRKGRELEIIADVKISYNLNRAEISAIATELTFGEVKPERNFALEIYIAKQNESIWDVAKRLNISTDELLEQNVELTLPINAGDKIVCYSKKAINFV